MSTASILNDKLTEFSEWLDSVLVLDEDTVKKRRQEIKLKGRNFNKFHAEVNISNDDELISKFSKLKTQIRKITLIANGRAPPPPKSSETECKSQSPEPSNNNGDDKGKSSMDHPQTCQMGKDCNSTDPKHFYDFIHFDHPKSHDMIIKYEKILKKQQCQKIFDQHHQKKQANTNVSNEFSQFLTDEELAQQLSAMQDIETMSNSITNTRSKRRRVQRTTFTYHDSDEDAKESSSSDDDDDDEDFDENEARRTYRRKVKNRKKENERRKLEEETMDEAELERLRKERLDKLLAKTEAYMKTLTRRVRKNFRETDNDSNNQKPTQLSTNEVKDFLSGDNTKAIEQTKSLIGGTLKDYQQMGLRWMVTLNQMRLNGILADEMGLGKTVQVLGLLAYILDMNGTRGKHLIVAPLSTLSSWRDHFESWLPALNVYLHRGVAAERKERLIEINKGSYNADVVISTYQMVIRDAETLSHIQWNYLIVDEAHTLKNAKGKLFEALNAFSTRHRLLLTGTPLQNNLGELWSLLNFILPSIFDSAQSFESWFCTPFQHLHKNKKDKDKNKVDLPMTDEERLMVMDRLHRAIDPFLLRRMKKDVLPKMVKKEEIVIKVPISGMQSAIYQQLQKYQALRYKDDKKRHGFNNIMMQFRKCANHPYLFAAEPYDITDEIYRCSGKFVLLRHLIPKMKRFNHRMLIFCQFVQTMDILSEFLEFMDEPYLRIDGGTDSDDRIDYLSTFNQQTTENGGDQNEYSIFLLSTRACGLGLNLYSADTVILFDSDWNPQQDLQAMARCHRIGQKKEVRVFRLIADKTIEESIYDRAQKKLDLERKAIECGKFDFSISGKERKEFLQQILEQRTSVDNKYESDIERKKLNQLLSRTEEEWKVFEQMDKENENEFKSLLTEQVLPKWLEMLTTDKDEIEALPTKRRRKQMSYNEDAYYKQIENKLRGKGNHEDDGNVSDKENKDGESKEVKKRKVNKRKRKRQDMDKDGDEENVEDDGNKVKRRRLDKK